MSGDTLRRSCQPPAGSLGLQAIYQQRFPAHELRALQGVWQVLVEGFFQRHVPSDAAVLDVAAGYCTFINHVCAREKWAVDANSDVRAYAAADVTCVVTGVPEFEGVPLAHFDVAFISNFLEHLPSPDAVIETLERVRALLKPDGRLMILQPNFRLLGAAYFDFIDHRIILTEKNLAEALRVSGFEVVQRIVRFLPYTSKSRVPKVPGLVRLYLRLPLVWPFLGKQSFFLAKQVLAGPPLRAER